MVIHTMAPCCAILTPPQVDLPTQRCHARFSFSKAKRKPKYIDTPARRSTTFSKGTVELRWERVTSTGKREIRLSYLFGNGILTRILAMTRRFSFPSTIDP